MNIDKAKNSYIMECHKVGKVPLVVSVMTYDKISEQYTLSNSRDGEFADISPDGMVLRMHWNR